MSSVTDAHQRVVRSLRLGRAGRLVVAVVRSGVPLLHARIELRSALRREGYEVVEQDIAEHPHLVAALEAAVASRPDAVALVHGFEALPREERTERLRRSNFGRARLQRIPRPFILIIRDTTWQWIGRELPDLARWADGPVMIADTDEHEPLVRWGRVAEVLHGRSSYRDPQEDFSVCLELHRRTPVVGTILGRLGSAERPRVVVIAGCPGSGRHHSMRHVLWSLDPSAVHRRLLRVSSVSLLFAGSQDEQHRFVASLRERIRRAPGPAVALFCDIDRSVEPAFLRCVAEAQRQTGKWVLCPAASQALFSRAHERIRQETDVLYLAPVVVRHRDGAPSPAGIEAMGALLGHRLARIGMKRLDVLEPAAMERLALASGGLPRLVLEAAAAAVSVANTDRLHFEFDQFQRVALRDVEIALSQLQWCPSPSDELLDRLEGIARTADPVVAAEVEPYAMVQLDEDGVFGAVHPLMAHHLAMSEARRASA